MSLEDASKTRYSLEVREMKKILYILIITLASCSLIPTEHSENVVAELNGVRLLQNELDQVTSTALDAEDSAAIADTYIRQWATNILLYDEAQSRTSEELESLVAEYRRSLYVHEYEQRLVAKHQPKEWPDSLMQQVYEQYQSRLQLREHIIRGVFMVVPKGTPQLAQLRTWLKKMTDKNVDKIEKYAFQYASGYELFPDTWRTANQVLLFMPVDAEQLEKQLRTTQQIEVEDSTSVYLLQVTDKHFAGETMPQDYARGAIEQILLNQWQVTYLEQNRKELYDEAVRFNKLKRYEK